MPLGMQTSVELPANQKPYYGWPIPILAFAGVVLLIAFGRNSWGYSLPFGENAQTNSQTLGIRTDLLRGVADVPKTAQIGAPLKVGGWLVSLDPSMQPQELIVYLDGKPVGETEVFYPALLSLNGQSLSIKSWRVDLFLKDMQPGSHTLALQAVRQGREPIALTQTTILVFR